MWNLNDFRLVYFQKVLSWEKLWFTCHNLLFVRWICPQQHHHFPRNPSKNFDDYSSDSLCLFVNFPKNYLSRPISGNFQDWHPEVEFIRVYFSFSESLLPFWQVHSKHNWSEVCFIWSDLAWFGSWCFRDHLHLNILNHHQNTCCIDLPTCWLLSFVLQLSA